MDKLGEIVITSYNNCHVATRYTHRQCSSNFHQMKFEIAWAADACKVTLSMLLLLLQWLWL